MSSAAPEERHERSPGLSVRPLAALPTSAASGQLSSRRSGESPYCGDEVALLPRRKRNHERPSLRAR
jgi:hypothetical protein